MEIGREGRGKGRKDEGGKGREGRGKDDGRVGKGGEGRGKDKGKGAEFCGIILKELFINSLWVVNWIWEEKRI
jgi:hypothetical protein